MNNYKFSMLSLNVRGIRDFKKRKTLFTWINQKNADIVFLQETYSTPEIIDSWRLQWRGNMYYAHGSTHSKGVLILIREDLDFRVNSVECDESGRFVLLKAYVQNSLFLFVNIYAPNKENEQCLFFKTLSNLLNEESSTCEEPVRIIIGGDFNVFLNTDLDCSGGKPTLKKSVKNIQDLKQIFDLVDIWRLRNPTKKKFSWRQKTPFIQRRLDYWLIEDTFQEDIDTTDTIPAIKTDHSAIILKINSIPEHKKGPSYWKFNNSLIDDSEYTSLITTSFSNWIEEYEYIEDQRLLWDLIKYKIRQTTIGYSKGKAKLHRKKLEEAEVKLKLADEKCGINPTEVNITELEKAKMEYETLFDYVIQGNIICLRANGLKREKKITYFLGLENNRAKKKIVYREFIIEGEMT